MAPAVRPEPNRERSGARVSLVSRPDQARSHTASASCWSVHSGWVVARTWSAICRKKRPYPPESVVSTDSWSADSSSGCGGGRSSGALSARKREIQPSLPGSAPAPAQTTSPVVVSSSSIAGV